MGVRRPDGRINAGTWRGVVDSDRRGVLMCLQMLSTLRCFALCSDPLTSTRHDDDDDDDDDDGLSSFTVLPCLVDFTSSRHLSHINLGANASSQKWGIFSQFRGTWYNLSLYYINFLSNCFQLHFLLAPHTPSYINFTGERFQKKRNGNRRKTRNLS